MISELMGFEELSHSIGAQLISTAPSSSHPAGFDSVDIDSRSVKEGALFVALSGSSADGHNFVKAAFDSGASGAMVELSRINSLGLENIAKKAGKALIAVENTMKGLQDSAMVYLEKFPKLLKIGITGSSGKTTTKEVCGSIISQEKNTVINMGNLNSETGLPLSAFTVRAHHEVCVFELGMNRRGEIAELAAVYKPNISLITNIGTSHIGILGTKQAIAEEKKNIFSLLTDNGIALIPNDDEYRDFLARDVKGKVSFYGKNSFAELENVRDLGLEGSEITWAGEKIRFPLPGKHCLDDAVAAIAIAKEVPVSAAAIKRGLEKVKPLFGRAEVLKGRATVIRDCYNASPESMAKSIELCDSLDWPGRRVYVIADMKELGESSVSAHEKLGERLCASKADMVFLYGSDIKAAVSRVAQNGRKYMHTCCMDELSAALDSYVKSGDLVLLKGSRACKLEKLGEILIGKNTEACDVS